MPKVRSFAPIAVFVFCLSSTGNAEDSGYWSIELPVPDYATNVIPNVDRQFLVRSVSFDWEAEGVRFLTAEVPYMFAKSHKLDYE